MAKYSLDRLNDKELEELSRDILQEELGIRFESFGRGRDKGIDLRYSPSKKSKKIIAQVKHFQSSGFSKLFSKLKAEEIKKVRKLAPKRYILITSVSLTPQQKDNILVLFTPFIQNTGDIYGLEDIENSIDRFPKILKAHPKLYLTNIIVLEQVFHAHIASRSKDKLLAIRDRVYLYVVNDKYKEAIEVLNERHFLIITGEPGIGKTSLAEFICFQHVMDGFQFVYILSDLTDAEKLIDTEDNVIFYFDDFLGANYLKIKQDQHADSRLLSFVHRVAKSTTKRLILTTRTTILSQASQDFEKLKHPVINLARHEIHISNYSSLQKARILYNHIYHSKLGVEFIENFIKNKTYKQIIGHPNYNPRLIDHITDTLRLSDVAPEKYHDYILDKLKNPADIWLDAYRTQISEEGRLLLQTVFSMPDNSYETLIRTAFRKRVEYEVKQHNFHSYSGIYDAALHELLESFIHRKDGGNGSYLQFYNPSIADFLSHYLTTHPDEIERILESICYTEQFRHSFTTKKLEIKQANIFPLNTLFGDPILFPAKIKVSDVVLLPILSRNLLTLNTLNANKTRNLHLVGFLLDLFDYTSVDELVFLLIKDFNFSTTSYAQFEDLLALLDYLGYQECNTFKAVHSHVDDIVVRLFEIADSELQFERIRDRFDEFGLDYTSFRDRHQIRLQSIIDNFWSRRQIEERISNEDISEIYEEYQMRRKIERIEEQVTEFNESLMLEASPGFEYLTDFDIEKAIEENKELRDHEDYNATLLQPKKQRILDPEKEIDNLFDNLTSIKE